MSRGNEKDNTNGETVEKSDDKKKSRRYNQYGSKNRHNRSYGKNRYHGRNDRRHFKKVRFDLGERLKEVDLGVTEFINNNVKGFTGTIKERYTDFIVHEICPNGEIAKLTDQKVPPDPDVENIEDLRKKVSEDIWEKLQTITEDNAGIEIDVTDMDRDQRRCIHQIVKKLTSVISETKDVGDKKVIVFSKVYKNEFGTSNKDNRKDWSMVGGDYCHFILHKVNMDTMNALNQIAKVLRLKSSIFNYAGTKDRRAKTTQWISVKKLNPKKIMHAARILRGIYVGNFKFENEPLKLGHLKGNRFTIALRNVTAPDDVIEKAMANIYENGFINYYGLQRFGTIAAIPTYEIGKALLHGNWEEAVELILKPRDGERDGNLAEAREIYKNTKDSRRAYQKIGRNDKIEAKLLWGIDICGQKNLPAALDMVPRNTMLMYIHAYQSIVWNKIVSKRIKEYGLKPIVGDLVYENPDSIDDIEIPNAETHQTTVDEKGKSYTNEKVADGAKEQKVESSEKTYESSTDQPKNAEKKEDSKTKDSQCEIPKIKILTEKDLPNYTIADIVMPQPGWKVTYPPYAKSWFNEHLEKDGLTTDLEQKNKKYALGGSYRKILQVPKNLSWNIIRYVNKTDDLIASDINEMRDIEAPKDNPDGSFKALVIQMSLTPTAYATMALREILKCDISSQTHAAQSAALRAAQERNEDAKKREQNKNSIDSTEDEDNDKTAIINLSTASTILDDSGKEGNKFSSKNESQKHESDIINDSGIEPGTVINA